MHTVVAQEWYEYERGWGSKSFGVTIHANLDSHKQYLENFYKDRSCSAPDWYLQEYGQAFLIKISDVVYKQLVTEEFQSMWYSEKLTI